MSTTSPDVALAAAYGTRFAKGIILAVWKSLADQGITIYPNIKGPTKFGKMAAGKGLKPYDGNFDPDGKVTFTDRQLTPALATYEIRTQVLKYFNTWMADMISASVAKKDIPFANFMWQQVVEEIVDEVISSVIYKGDTDYSGGDNARKITNGFGKIIGSMGLSEVITGPIDDDDVVDQIELVYRSIPSKYRKYLMNTYVSISTGDKYDARYRDRFKLAPTYNEFRQTKLDFGNGKCMLKPVDWLEGDEIIIAPPQNLVLGTDSESDMNTIKSIETVYGFDSAITFSLGLQVPDPEVIFINDEVGSVS